MFHHLICNLNFWPGSSFPCWKSHPWCTLFNIRRISFSDWTNLQVRCCNLLFLILVVSEWSMRLRLEVPSAEFKVASKGPMFRSNEVCKKGFIGSVECLFIGELDLEPLAFNPFSKLKKGEEFCSPKAGDSRVDLSFSFLGGDLLLRLLGFPPWNLRQLPYCQSLGSASASSSIIFSLHSLIKWSILPQLQQKSGSISYLTLIHILSWLSPVWMQIPLLRGLIMSIRILIVDQNFDFKVLPPAEIILIAVNLQKFDNCIP